MLGSGNVRHRVYISYGALIVVFSYLPALEVIQFQAASKFMYFRGVERLQKSLHLERHEIFYFHYPGMGKWQNTLFAYYKGSKQPVRHIK